MEKEKVTKILYGKSIAHRCEVTENRKELFFQHPVEEDGKLVFKASCEDCGQAFERVEEKKEQYIHIDLSEDSKINIKAQGMDAMVTHFVLQQALAMVTQRIQEQAKLIVNPSQMSSLKKFN
jgi:hypothetical protein